MRSAPTQPETKTPLPKENYDHLIPPANRVLRFTLKAGWYLVKGLAKIAIRLPRFFVHVNEQRSQTPPKK